MVEEKPTLETIWAWLSQVPDPEITVIALTDLGIIRDVQWQGDTLEVTVTPTYSGCPATSIINLDIETALRGKGLDKITLKRQLSPAWTTDRHHRSLSSHDRDPRWWDRRVRQHPFSKGTKGMSQFHPLTVTHIHRTIRDAVVLTLQPEDLDAFVFTQGQYLTFKQDFDGTELRRNYSICAGLDDGVLQVGIKRVNGGAFSTFANTELSVGDTLHAMPPQGKFYTEIEPNRAKTYLGFAGGSGVTPILSILKTVLMREPDSTFTLVYANRAVNTIMFREELEDLKNRYMGRLTLIHMLESGQDIDLFTGRVDAAKCAALFEHWIDVSTVDTAFICGPEPMMLAIADSLKTHGLEPDQIKFELFSAGQQGQLGVPPAFAK